MTKKSSQTRHFLERFPKKKQLSLSQGNFFEMVNNTLRCLLLSGAAICAVATAPMAETVRIQSVDGNISIEGRIISFDGETFELDTLAGTRIPARMVICTGDACPQIADDPGIDGTAKVVDAPTAMLVSKLVRNFSDAKDWTLEAGPSTDTQGGTFDFDDIGSLTIDRADGSDVFEALLKGETSFVLTSSPISDDVADELVAEGYTDLRGPGREIIIALDAIVPQVHPDNPVRDISLPILARIAAGRIQNWAELGGPDQPIRFILPGESSSVTETLEDRIMRPNRLRVQRDVERVADEAEAVAITASDPLAITLASGVLVDDTKPLPIRQVCGPLSFATDFSVKAEEYPLTRRILLYTDGSVLSQSVKELVAYAGSQDAQESIRALGFVGQNVEALPLSLHGSRLASAILYAETLSDFDTTRNLTTLLAPAERLSTTFRFASNDLDNKSLRDAVRIAEYLTEPANSNRDVELIGFTDSVGRSDLNSLLSLQQATKVKDAIINASNGAIDPDRINVSSFGSVAPVGCNSTVEGRNSNRRVEVWLR